MLDKIAVQEGVESRNKLIEKRKFTYHYEENGEEKTTVYTGAELGVNNIFPYSARSNYVPWVIVYEPMICTYLADSDVSVFLTATEYAMAQGVIYNWHTVKTDRKDYCVYCGNTYPTGRLYPQCVQSMAFRNLPSSVTLRESWFGYETMEPVGENASVSIEDIISKGGWGMGYLSTMALPEIQRRIEWGDQIREGDLGVEIVMPEKGYTAGADAVTSVIVRNFREPVLPEYGVSVCLTVTDCDSGDLIFRGTKNGIALPGYEDTYVWFRWHNCKSGDGNIRIDAEILTGCIKDIDLRDNADTVFVPVEQPVASSTATPGFYDRKPSGFGAAEEPETAENRVGWYFWDYDGEVFSKYEISLLSGAQIQITPDPSIRSTVGSGNGYTVRSGYGYEIRGVFEAVAEVRKTVRIDESEGDYSETDEAVTSGRIFETVLDAITDPAAVCVYFPEFLWSEAAGSFTSLENTGDGLFAFAENPDASGDRIHYMPLWYPDGISNYYVYAAFSGVGTPGGELHVSVCSNSFSVDGSLYDDWYVGRG